MAQNKSAKHAGHDGYYRVTVSNGAKQMLGMLDAVQPHSQGLSSPHPKGSKGRKALVHAGHVFPKKWEVTKKQ